MASHRKVMRRRPMMIMTFTTCFHFLAPLAGQDIAPTETPYPLTRPRYKQTNGKRTDASHPHWSLTPAV
ncbi:hypothetical protein CGRA01v4_04891 [Colletotrichum graminicola]|nr:hypothetical protein CGRA01v4_04891 [Colletotrichum graminicola]